MSTPQAATYAPGARRHSSSALRASSPIRAGSNSGSKTLAMSPGVGMAEMTVRTPQKASNAKATTRAKMVTETDGNRDLVSFSMPNMVPGPEALHRVVL